MLGLDLAAWKAMSPRNAAAACVPAATDARRTDCRMPIQPIGGRYYARNLTYEFVGGRLATVRFRSSIDGFAFVTAALKQAYGEPASTVRNDIKLADGLFMPHVAMRWRTAHGQAVLSDPADAGSLEVTITATTPAPAAMDKRAG